MKSMIALEKLIKELEVRISSAKGQLSRHDTGEEQLTLLTKASAENSLEYSVPVLDKYRNLLKELEKYEKLDSFEHRRLRASIERKKYYKFAIKEEGKKKSRENDEKIEAALIIDELPEEYLLNKEELFEIATKNIKPFLTIPDDAKSDLEKIQNDFNGLIKNFTDENIKSLEPLNYIIPIVIFHFKVFMFNIIEYSQNELPEPIEELEFFPKYHDWWITEMWSSHIAYFSLFQWKNFITQSCITDEYKEVWSMIFNNWLFVKTSVSEKSELAFEYQYIFDNLLTKYANIESELDVKKLKSKKIEIETFIENEDLLSLIPNHHVLTPYINYKKSL
jgi:hypothetical protein